MMSRVSIESLSTNEPSSSADRLRPERIAEDMRRNLGGPAGIEPATIGLKVRCSTAELRARETPMRTQSGGVAKYTSLPLDKQALQLKRTPNPNAMTSANERRPSSNVRPLTDERA